MHSTNGPLLLPLLFMSLFISTLTGLTNLEEVAQGFVLETRQIIIPDHPEAFNPSIVRWNGSLVMSFRELTKVECKSTGETSGYVSKIGLVRLDDDFMPISDAQILDLSIPGQESRGREEDGRLVVVDGRLYLVFSDNKEAVFTNGGFRIYVTELSCDEHGFSCSSPESILRFEGQNSRRREKNWTPFDLDGQLHFAYSVNPHVIFKPIPDTQSCETISRTYSQIPWQWGELRGGTPGLRISDSEYLTFFHSSKTMATRHSDGCLIDHYFFGAYTFSSSYPYEVRAVSPEPIIGPSFYEGVQYGYYWRPVVVVFPCGYVHDDNYIWISYGRQDHEMWIVKIDKQALLDSLAPVQRLL